MTENGLFVALAFLIHSYERRGLDAAAREPPAAAAVAAARVVAVAVVGTTVVDGHERLPANCAHLGLGGRSAVAKEAADR